MKIASIKREKKHLTKILFEDGGEAALDSSLCDELCLKAGADLTDERLKEIKEQSDYIRTRSRALWYLDRSSHTERGLYDKLRRAGFSENSCAAVISRFCELGLLDDRRYAENYAERCAEAGMSRRAISDKLYAKGVPRDIIKETVSELSVDEGEQVRAVIDKKYKTKLAAGETEKVFAALMRKGFSYGAVRDALRKYAEEIEYTEEV